jgi:hypothetical protein
MIFSYTKNISQHVLNHLDLKFKLNYYVLFIEVIFYNAIIQYKNCCNDVDIKPSDYGWRG